VAPAEPLVPVALEPPLPFESESADPHADANHPRATKTARYRMPSFMEGLRMN
jgi:hypothetical protein